MVLAGFRELAIEVTARLGTTIGARRLRYLVEASALPIGNKGGGVLLFDEGDVLRAAELVKERLDAEAAERRGQRPDGDTTPATAG